MKAAMTICQEMPEVLWNAIRLDNIMLEGMEDVGIFLNGPSVNYTEVDAEQFPLKELAKIFTLSKGRLFCLRPADGPSRREGRRPQKSNPEGTL